MSAPSRTTDNKQNQKDSTRSAEVTRQNGEATPAFSAQHSLLSLHRSIGNRAFGQVLQAKLAISLPGDVYEQEADRVADQVMSAPTPMQPSIREAPPQIHRFSGQSNGSLNTVPASVNQVLASSGSPLDTPLRQDMEQRLGHDFSQVRVHTSSAAEQSAQEMSAKAYTVGNDIVFNTGRFAPSTDAGRRLVAHELTHVVQQQVGAGTSNVLQRSPDDKDEKQIEYPLIVPQGITTLKELHSYAEVLIFGKVMNLRWISNAKGPPKAGETAIYQFQASLVSKHGGKKEGTAIKPPSSNPAYEKTKGTEREIINKEINKRYSKGTAAPQGEEIKKGEQAKIDMWNVYRDQVMNDKTKLKALPAEIKELMGGEPSFQPQDYERLLQIAEKLKKFSPEDIAVYRMLSLRATDNLDLFEKSVDMFLARKEELKKAFREQEQKRQTQAGKTQGPQSVQEAIEESWKGFDSSKISKMSEDDRYDLARRQTWEATKAQLEYMKNHPGETAVDFAKTATLMNTGDTFKGIGKDIAEAASGDANAWARWAGGVGAGAKLSGWLLAVGGVLYVLSWLTGVGELATIVAFMGAMLASTIVLSTAESELRIKAASQAKTPEEFKEQVTKAAAARTNVLLMIGLLAVALALRFVAKTFFPETVAKISRSLARFREKVRIVGKLSEAKAEFVTEMEGHRKKLVEAGESAKESAKQQADALDKMSLEEFVNKLESGSGDFFQEAAVQEGQKVPWKALAKTPEGLKAIEAYKAQLTDGLRNTVPKEIDSMVKEQTDAVDTMLEKVKKATVPDEFEKAINEHEKFMSNEEVAKRGKAKEEQMRKQKAEEALKDLDQEIKKFELSSKAAKELVRQAQAEQKTVTTDFTEIANANGVKMEGLDKAIKTESTLTQKIVDRVRPADVAREGLEKAVEKSAAKINDALRFTMVLDVKTYVVKILAIKAAMAAKGYQFIKLWNGWTQSDGTYMGVNMTLKTPKGQLIELQFHTSESFKIKMETHGLYEEARPAVATEATKVKSAQQQKEAYKGIKVPSDIKDVDRIK